VILSGDEEEASRQEGCSEEKEVALYTSDYAGGGTPQRDSYFILSWCYSSRERILCRVFIYFQAFIHNM
jgi:hypothetical protein